MTADTHAIAANEILRDLDPAQQAQIEQLVTYQTYPTGHIFYMPYERGEQLYILQSGRVRLYKLSAEGRALTLAILEPVSIFGEMTLAGQWMHDSFAETMTTSHVGIIGREALRQILQQNPQVTMSFMQLMGQRLRETEEKLSDIAFKSVPQRLATVLLNMAGLTGGLPSDVELPSVVRYTHQQLAEMIGSYRETVTKTIGEFREAGFIRVDGDTIYLTNLQKLQHLANM